MSDLWRVLAKTLSLIEFPGSSSAYILSSFGRENYSQVPAATGPEPQSVPVCWILLSASASFVAYQRLFLFHALQSKDGNRATQSFKGYRY